MKMLIVLSLTLLTFKTFAQSSNLKIILDQSQSTQATYHLMKNGWFQLPTKLMVKNGSLKNQEVKISYNMLADGNYEFHCLYKTSSRKTLSFSNCETPDGVTIIQNVADLESMDFPMDQYSTLQINLLNATAKKVKIEANYIVDWK